MTNQTVLPARLLEQLAASAVREGLADAVYSRVDSPFGELLVVQGPRGIVRIGFPEEPEERVLGDVADVLGARIVKAPAEMSAVRETLSSYLEGGRDTFDLPVDLALVTGEFRRRVLDVLRSVPRGEVVSYAGLAARAGRPAAARAAGTACARNPVPLVVPCHRVVPSGGGVGSYAGGSERKRALLALEGVVR